MYRSPSPVSINACAPGPVSDKEAALRMQSTANGNGMGRQTTPGVLNPGISTRNLNVDSHLGGHNGGHPNSTSPTGGGPPNGPLRRSASNLWAIEGAARTPEPPSSSALTRMEAMLEYLVDAHNDVLGNMSVVRDSMEDIRGALIEVGGLTNLTQSHSGNVTPSPSVNVGAAYGTSCTSAGLTDGGKNTRRFVSFSVRSAEADCEAGGHNALDPRFSDAKRTSRDDMSHMTRRMSGGHIAIPPADGHGRKGSFAIEATNDLCMPSEATAQEEKVMVAAMLPRGWPRTVELREEFPHLGAETEKVPSRSAPDSAAFARRFSAAATTAFTAADLEESEEPLEKRSHCFIRDPDSRLSTLHNFIGVIVLIVDLTMIPFTLAWDFTDSSPIRLYNWCSAVFWTMDVLTSCVTGYYDKGIVVMRMKRILSHYLKTWAVIDMMTCGSDWLSLILAIATEQRGEASGVMKLVRFIKLSRFLRVVGAFRIMKFQQFVKDFADRQLSETWRFISKIVNFAVMFLWCNHLLTCLWFAVGRSSPSDVDLSWLDVEAPGLGGPYKEGPTEFQYFAAFHWSLAQITLGSTTIQSISTAERMVNITYLLLGLLVTTTLVSSLSASMVDLQISQKDKKDKMRTLRTFLRDNSVNSRLANCVQQQAIDRLSTRGRLLLKDVQVLTMVAPTLQMEIRFEICRRHLCQHPLFRLWISLDQRTVQNFFMDPIELVHVRDKDDVFLAGAAGEAAYIGITGDIKYTQDPASSPVEEIVTETVQPKRVLAEACLWTQWIHVGTACASQACELLKIGALPLMEALKKHGILREVTVEYGNFFHQRLRLAQPPGAPWPDDLQVPFTDFGDLVRSMSIDVQVTVGFDALRYITKPQLGVIAKLKDEIASGKCVVIVDGGGEVRRCVSLVTLSVEHADGSVFYQVGKLNHTTGTVETNCQLPGNKFEWRETIEEAIPRILRMKIACFERSCTLKKVEREVQDIVSQAYGIPTTYLRVVCHLELDESAQSPAWRAQSNVPFWELPAAADVGQSKSFVGDKDGMRADRSVQPSSAISEATATKSTKFGDPTRSSRTSQVDVTKSRGFGGVGGPRPSTNSWFPSSEGGQAMKNFCEDLSEKEVFIVKETVAGKKAYNLYTWLLPVEFDMLKTGGQMAHVLEPWLQSLDIPLTLEESL